MSMHNIPKYITYVQYIIQGVSTLLMYILVTNVEFLVSENINIYLFCFILFLMMLWQKWKLTLKLHKILVFVVFVLGLGEN